MLAAGKGNGDGIQVLLDQKADVNAKDKLRGTTALMWAAEQAHPAAVQLLIEHGAAVLAASNPDTRNARNNLADTVTKRLNSRLGVVRQARARANNKRAPGASPVPADAGAQNPPEPLAEDAEAFPALFEETRGGGLTPVVYAASQH